MPELVRSFFNPNGSEQSTGVDSLREAALARRQAAGMQSAEMQARLTDAAANRALQLQMGGSYADRSRDAAGARTEGFAHDTAMEGQRGTNALAVGRQSGEFGLAGIMEGNVPELGRQAEQRRQWDAVRGDTQTERDLASAYSGAELGMVRKLFPDQAASAAAATAGGAAGMAPAGGQPMSQDQAIMQLMRMKNPQAYFDSERRALERSDAQEASSMQTFSIMAASQDPRVRAVGVAGLQKTKTFGPLGDVVQGLTKPLASAGSEFVAAPETQREIAAIGQELAVAQGDTNAAQMAERLTPRIDRLVAMAAEQGGDPEQVRQEILEQLGKLAPAATLGSNPITSTLGAIPGVRALVPEPSRDAARRVVGIR